MNSADALTDAALIIATILGLGVAPGVLIKLVRCTDGGR